MSRSVQTYGWLIKQIRSSSTQSWTRGSKGFRKSPGEVISIHQLEVMLTERGGLI